MRRLVALAASLWTTLAALAALGALLLASRLLDRPVDALVAVPLFALGVNLLAAIAATQKLRRNLALLVFHLSLAALAALAGLGALTALTGHVEVTEGAAFDPALVEADAGPLHRWRLDRVDFVQRGFTIDYEPGMKRRATRSQVEVAGPGGRAVAVEIGDDRPLVVDGYRFYTSFNKGFAPVLTWRGAGGGAATGAVHLPSYPLNDYRQGNEWRLPDGSRTVKLWLSIPVPVAAEDRSWRFAKPAAATLVVLDGGARHELAPGDAVTLETGELRFDELRSWMGYSIFFDATTPWMIAAALLAALSFALHVVTKLRPLPERLAEPGEAVRHAG